MAQYLVRLIFLENWSLSVLVSAKGKAADESQVGDGGCGKTCLLFVYAREEFPEVSLDRAVKVELMGEQEYIPTVFETYAMQCVSRRWLQLASCMRF